MSRTSSEAEIRDSRDVPSPPDTVTRIEALEAALANEKRLGDSRSGFLSIVSHEFRTPLTVILSSAELLELQAATLTAEGRDVFLKRIKSAAKHMTALLSDVLLIGKTDAEQVRINFSEFDLLELGNNLLSELRTTIPESACVTLDTKGAPHKIRTDQKLLRAILQNLLSNAVKYSGGAIRIQMLLEYQTRSTAITVADQGIGIPESDQQHLFELFHRGANTKSVPGTGLGLSIVKRFVELLGGEISFHSHENEGSRFTVLLPYQVS